jgi:hypothetical protein
MDTVNDSTLPDSHLDAIRKICRTKKIIKALEFGSGEISTIGFLNKKICPDLKHLISIEDIEKWYNKIKLIVKDERWEYRFVQDEISMIPVFKENINIDLILIDSQSVKGRVYILTALLKDPTPFIILHDSEQPDYLHILESFKYSYFPETISPHKVGVVSNMLNLKEIFQIKE